jgi:hypothetical protein
VLADFGVAMKLESTEGNSLRDSQSSATSLPSSLSMGSFSWESEDTWSGATKELVGTPFWSK